MRLQRLQELKQKEDQKLNDEIEINRQKEVYKAAQKDLERQRKQDEIERKIQDRIDNRMKSKQEMVERTKSITRSLGRPQQDLEYLKRFDGIRNSQIEGGIKEQSQKYEDILKQKKE